MSIIHTRATGKRRRSRDENEDERDPLKTAPHVVRIIEKRNEKTRTCARALLGETPFVAVPPYALRRAHPNPVAAMSDYAAKAEDFMSKAQKKLAVRGRATGLRSRHTRSRATLDRDARVFAACARTEMCSSSRTRISRRRVVCPFSCRAP